MSNLSRFEKLYKSTMDISREEILAHDWTDKAFYTNWVGQTYHFLCQSTRMIPFAASQFTTEDEALFSRCVEHSHEEQGHHLMAKNDLKYLGSDISQHPLMWATEQLYAYPYRVISAVDPIGIFGINAYMEGLSIEVGKTVAELVTEKFGQRSASFIISHTNDDEEHIKQVFQALESCSNQRLEVIERVFLGANFNFLQMLVGAANLTPSRLEANSANTFQVSA